MLNGTTTPKIELRNASTATYTITLASWLESIKKCVPLWPPVFDVPDAMLANSTRSIKRYECGYRFQLELAFSDHYIASAPTLTTGREYFEWLIDQLTTWRLQAAVNVIRVYPYSANTSLYYDCLVTVVKTPIEKDNSKTLANDYSILLQAIDLVTTIPAPSPLPWV
jgi:hypothetical protein